MVKFGINKFWHRVVGVSFNDRLILKQMASDSSVWNCTVSDGSFHCIKKATVQFLLILSKEL